MTTSSPIVLASGQVTRVDRLTIELHQPTGSPPAILDQVADSVKRHQHRSERARERSGLGRTRHGRGASTTREDQVEATVTNPVPRQLLIKLR